MKVKVVRWCTDPSAELENETGEYITNEAHILLEIVLL